LNLNIYWPDWKRAVFGKKT